MRAETRKIIESEECKRLGEDYWNWCDEVLMAGMPLDEFSVKHREHPFMKLILPELDKDLAYSEGFMAGLRMFK